MKPALVREVRSMHMHCDRIGNILLAKFACKAARDCLVIFPASVVFWLLEHVPPTAQPLSAPPSGMPAISQDDWQRDVPRVLSVNCLVSKEGLRMTMKLDVHADITLLLSQQNVELMRQLMLVYRADLMDVGV